MGYERTGTVVLDDEDIERTDRDGRTAIVHFDPPVLETEHRPGNVGDDFGKCPVCQKPLRPHDPATGEPRTPPVGKGFSSRARCTSCGIVLYYKGGADWGILLESDLTDEDKAMDKLKW